MSDRPCSWCGVEVDRDDGFRALEPEGERHAVFCRLEHVVPWALRGAHWEAGSLDARTVREAGDTCAHCGEPADERRVLLVRHRGEHRVPDAFCSVDHAAAWARAGGRWR